jgi:dephospho-CoA kinase
MANGCRTAEFNHSDPASCLLPPASLLLIALTGNIASGKSEVARSFADLGATVIDADELSREVVRPGTPALTAIVERWGHNVMQPDGTLDRAKLRDIVFASPEEREALNRIVHPEVRRRRDHLVAEARTRGDPIVVAVIPLLFEAAMQHEFDRVVLVDAPEDVRLQRLRRRSGMTVEEARRMMAAQIDPAVKRPGAHVVIENDSTLAELRRKVDAAWKQLVQDARPEENQAR